MASRCVPLIRPVAAMDTEIGRVIQQLKDAGEWYNTMVFFSSDNGAEGTLQVFATVRDAPLTS